MSSNGHEGPANGEVRDLSIAVPGEAVNRLVIHLSVVYGQVQLLGRRARREKGVSRDELDAALARLEASTRALVADLADITGAPTRSSRGRDRV